MIAARLAQSARSALAVALTALAAGAAAAPALDVPFVPTPHNVVEAMLDLGRVGKEDYLIDLGCGDGRIVIAAAKKFGTRGLGVDLNEQLVDSAQRAAQREGVSHLASFQARNIFDTDLTRATVITMYLLNSINLRLRPQLLKLAPGTRIVSHDFDLDGWNPDARVTVAVPDKPYGSPSSEVFMWVVPADASGDWRWRATVHGEARDYALTIAQVFQQLHGAITVDGRTAGFARGRVTGRQVRFELGVGIGGRTVRHAFDGRMTDEEITGWITLDGDSRNRVEWRATRIARGRMDTTGTAPASN